MNYLDFGIETYLLLNNLGVHVQLLLRVDVCTALVRPCVTGLARNALIFGPRCAHCLEFGVFLYVFDQMYGSQLANRDSLARRLLFVGALI